MEFLSPKARTLTPYVPGEQPKGNTVYIKLNTNENPYPPAPAVLEAIHAAADEKLRLYPDPTAAALREAIAQREGLTPDHVFVGNGSDEVLAICFPAFFADTPIRFADITYSFYQVYAKLFDVPTEIIPLDADFCVDVAAFCRPGAGGVLLANPNAPTGIALSLEEIEQVLQANAHCVVVVDEAYVEFGAQSAKGLIERYPNLLIVRTLSKSQSLAGLRVGFALGQPHLIDGLTRVKDSFNSYPLDRMAQAGAIAAMQSDEYYGQISARIMATRERFSRALEKKGFTVLPSQTNFVFVRPRDGKAKELMQHLRENAVLVRHFDKPRISEWLRITIGTDEEMDKLTDLL